MIQVNASAGFSNEDMTNDLYAQLLLVNPYRLWQVQVYNNVTGGSNDNYHICFDCISYRHYADRYFILIASLATDSVANTAVLADSRIVNDADNKSDCQTLAYDIFNNLCVKGVYCVIRYVDTWMDNNFDERSVF